MSINTCTISGNLTKDSELRVTKGGTQLLTFSVAVNDRRKNPQTGQWEDVPNFIDVCLFGSRAEKLASMLTKGTKVCVFGKLRWSQWEANGNRRSKVEVIADDIEIMSRSKDQNQAQPQQPNNYQPQQQYAPNNAVSAPQGGYQQQYQQPYQQPYQQTANHQQGLYSEDVPF